MPKITISSGNRTLEIQNMGGFQKKKGHFTFSKNY